MDAAFEQQVRERAYAIWVAAGQEDGAADQHWLSAEQSLKRECEKPVATAKASKATAVKKVVVKKVATAAKPAKARADA